MIEKIEELLVEVNALMLHLKRKLKTSESSTMVKKEF
jgi:hypothetical protein